jgi:hypothetical protein
MIVHPNFDCFCKPGNRIVVIQLSCGDEAMVIEAGKRLKTVIVKKESIDHAGAFLQQLPEKPKENLSLREAINQLRDQLKAALIKGYSYEDLAKMLTGKGIDISPSTLKNYVPSGKRQAAKEQAMAAAPKTRRKRIGADTLVSEETAAPVAPVEDDEETAELPPAKPARGRGRSTAAKTKTDSVSQSTPEVATTTRQTRTRRTSTPQPSPRTAGKGRRKTS